MCPSQVEKMTITDALARDWVGKLESGEAKRANLPQKLARPIVARRIGVSPGSLENIARGRTKGIRNWIAERIKAAVIRELETEIRGLTHDLQVARQCGLGPGSPEVCSCKASLATALAALNEFDSNGEN